MRNSKIDNIRALAILLVVFGHSIIIYSNEWNLYSTMNTSKLLNYVKYIINIVQMPLFFSLSGFLFGYSTKKKIEFKKFIINKIYRLIVPFVVIGCVWMIPIKMLLQYKPYENENYFFLVFKFLLGNEMGHLWFLITLFFIFIIAYLLVYKIEILNIKYKKIYLFTIFIIFSILSLGCTYKYLSIPIIGNAIINFNYFLLGYIICKLEDRIKRNYYLILIDAVVIIISLKLKSSFYNYVISFFIVYSIYCNLCDKEIKILNKLSKDSFGIFLFHSPLIYITYTYLSNANFVIVIGMNFFLFGGLAWGLTELIRTTKLKFVIGEKNG